MSLYPLMTVPFYVKTPWGGTMLGDAFMKDAPAGTGESLEISFDAEKGAIVSSGSCAGRTLAAMINLWGSDLTGTDDSVLPVNVKLIDIAPSVEAPVSVCASGRAWVILNCEPDTAIMIDGNTIVARPGDVYYIPANAEAKAGAFMQIYELSATAAGVSVSASSNRIFGTTSLCKGGSRTYYVSDKSIELCRLNVFGKMPLDDTRMLALTPFAPCVLRCNDECETLMPFTTVLIPAALTGVSVESDDCKIMMAAVSNREALRADLGYRAENVIGLVD